MELQTPQAEQCHLLFGSCSEGNAFSWQLLSLRDCTVVGQVSRAGCCAEGYGAAGGESTVPEGWGAECSVLPWQVLAAGGRAPAADREQQPGRGVGHRLRPHSLGLHRWIWRRLHPRYSWAVMEFKM